MQQLFTLSVIIILQCNTETIIFTVYRKDKLLVFVVFCLDTAAEHQQTDCHPALRFEPELCKTCGFSYALQTRIFGCYSILYILYSSTVWYLKFSRFNYSEYLLPSVLNIISAVLSSP